METQDYPKAIDTFSDLTKVDNQNAEYFIYWEKPVLKHYQIRQAFLK